MAKINVLVEVDRGAGNKELRSCSLEADFNVNENGIIAIILESPDASKWRLKVDNAGAITAEAVV